MVCGTILDPARHNDQEPMDVGTNGRAQARSRLALWILWIVFVVLVCHVVQGRTLILDIVFSSVTSKCFLFLLPIIHVYYLLRYDSLTSMILSILSKKM